MHRQKIRLFVDAHCFDAEYQGTRTFVQELYRALSNKEDLLIYLAAYDVQELEKQFLSCNNIVFLKYKTRSRFYRMAFDIPYLIKKYKIDVAHFQYITPLVKNCRQVVTIHDVIFSEYPSEFSLSYRLVKKYLYKRSASNADIITTVSPFSKTSIQKHLVRNKKVHLIRNGVRQSFFEVHDKAGAKNIIKEKYGLNKFILYVSRVEQRKNHLSLLKAFLRLELYNKGYSLAFIGHTATPVPSLNKRLQSLDATVRKHIVLISNVPDSDLEQFYRAAEIFVYPSKAEGFGIPPLEAGAVQVPVICSNTSAMADFSFFEDCHIDPYDSHALEEKLKQLTENTLGNERLRRTAEQIAATYCWKKSAEEFYQLIRTHHV